MALRFGTDGVRGDARTDLTAEAVERLGRAGAEILGAEEFAVGRDPRASGSALAEAVHRGVAAAGGSSVDLGVLPTPAVARWCAEENSAGAMVSASHNPWFDNGVKFFAPGGLKLDDATQARIQARFEALGPSGRVASRTGDRAFRAASGLGPGADPGGRAATGRSEAAAAARRRHIEAVAASIGGRDLSGLSVVVDGANGAAAEVGPECLRKLGASVRELNTWPDGRNINEGCGSTHPEGLQAAVAESGADAGVAFDGDADRVIAVDNAGNLVDGDQIIAVCALDRHRRSALPGAGVVVTVMANGGLRRAMAAEGIEVVETAVGDRRVLEMLDRRGLALGGEQSGHVIFRDLATTGDGLLTAVQLLDALKRSGMDLAALAAAAMTRLPQVLTLVRLDGPTADLGDLEARLAPVAAAASERLAGTGRVLVRPSGTEPVVRVMVEADDHSTASAEADRLTSEIAAALA